MKLKWFPNAVKDLNKIYEYYAIKNPRAAALLYNKIIDEAELLENHPYIAAIEQILDDNPKAYRSLVVAKTNYKVLYYVENNVINIARVWDCRQNPEKLRKYVKRSLK